MYSQFQHSVSDAFQRRFNRIENLSNSDRVFHLKLMLKEIGELQRIASHPEYNAVAREWKKTVKAALNG